MKKEKKNKNRPIVSVIVPVYNVQEFLDESLRSIENQVLEDLEIIVLNDGSTDSSLKIMKKHAKRDARIKVVDKKNEGYGKTCNKGLKLASGEFVAIVEPDDWIDEDMYYEMVRFACESELKYGKKIDIVKTPWFDVRDWNNKSSQYEINGYLYSRLKTSLKPTDISEKSVILEKHPSIWSAIYRRSFLLENNIKFPKFPGSGWADNPFMIDTLTSAKNIVYLNKPYYHYRVDLPGSTLNHKTDELVALPFERWCSMTKRLRKKGVTDVRVWQAHYKRGFDYVHGAIVDDGWDNAIVQEKTRQVFDMMKPELVFDIETYYPEIKALYADLQGDTTKVSKSGAKQIKFYLKETLLRLKQRGVKDSLQIVARETKNRGNLLTKANLETKMDSIHKSALKKASEA